MRVITTEQRTPEWYAAKLGCISGSNAALVLTQPRTKKDKETGVIAKATQSYLDALCAEVMTGESRNIINTAMQWGIDYEDQAIDVYCNQLTTASTFEQVGFVKHDTLNNVGCSPDGISDGMIVEIKCPYVSANHVSNMRGEIDRKYVLQMQFNMWICGAMAAEFVSYDPRMPSAKQLYTKEIERDQAIIDKLNDVVPKLSWMLENQLMDLLAA